ncbi:MAG TPA: hypothetical protein VF997_03835 [Polyangia bacterium]
MKKRWLAALVLAFVAGCASATQAPVDASVDLTMGHCDQSTLFSSCSAQCNMPICIVARATCMDSQWVCDCTQTGPCGADMRHAD